MLSKEEAVSFVTETLKLTSPLEKIRKDPYHFLGDLILAYHVAVPFQNVSLISVAPHLRHR